MMQPILKLKIHTIHGHINLAMRAMKTHMARLIRFLGSWL
jgi:hypothetical protein